MKVLSIQLFAICSLLAISCAHVARASVSPQGVDFLHDPPTCFELATVTNYFIALGESNAVKELTRQWKPEPRHRVPTLTDHSLRYKISWICRIAFTPEAGKSLRSPAFGGIFIPIDFTTDGAEWPCFPLVESEGVFFLLGDDYLLAGSEEDPIDYLKYCQTNGVFRSAPLDVPSEEKAAHALDALFQSKRWKKIKWDPSPFPFVSGNYDLEVAYLKQQTQKANRSPEPTAMSVTRSAAQESRQP